MGYLELNKRLEIVKSALKFGVSEASRIYSISRPTITKWVKRFKEGGYEALKNKERTHSHHPNKMPESIEEEILNYKRTKPNVSASFIKRELNLGYDLKIIIKKLRKAGLYDKEDFESYAAEADKRPLFKDVIISFDKFQINNFSIKVIILHDKHCKFMIPFLIERLSYSNVLYAVYYLQNKTQDSMGINFYLDKTTDTYIERLINRFSDKENNITFNKFEEDIEISLRFFTNTNHLYAYLCNTSFEKSFNILILLNSLYNSGLFRNTKNEDLKEKARNFMQAVDISDSVYKQLIHSRELEETYNLSKKYAGSVVELQIMEAYKYFKSCFESYNYIEADKIYTIINYLLNDNYRFSLTYIDSLRKYGQLKFQQGMISTAEKLFSEAERISISLQDNQELIKSYRAITNFYKESGYYQKAFTTGSKLLNLLKKINLKREYLSAKLLLAEIIFRSHKYEKAARTYNEVLEGSRKYFPQNFLNALFGLSATEFILGNFSIAWQNLKKAEKAALEDNNENIILENFFKFGEIYIRNDYFRYRYIKTLAEKSENYTTKLELMNSLEKLGDIFFELEEFKNSLHYYQRALIIAKENNHTYNYNKCLTKTGNVLVYQNKFNQAYKILQEGYYISMKNNFLREQIFYLTRLARVLIHKKKNSQAKNYANQALKLAELHNYPELISDALIACMYSEFYHGEYDKVNKLMNKTKDYCVKYRNIRNLIIIHLIGATAAKANRQLSYSLRLFDIGINLTSNIKINYFKSELLYMKLSILCTNNPENQDLADIYNKAEKAAKMSERDDMLSRLNELKTEYNFV